MVVWMALACAGPKTLTLTGTVFDSSDALAPRLGGAEVSFVDNLGDPLAAVVADEKGDFSVILPSGATVFAEITADGYALATFPGVTGLSEVEHVEDRAIHGVSLAREAALREQFVGCPGTQTQGALVVGEIRVFNLTDPLTGGNPTTSAGAATVYDIDGNAFEACYLDADALLYDPEAYETGASGMFAIFGVPSGLFELEVTADFGPGLSSLSVYPVWIPKGAIPAVSPWFPAFVEF